MLKRHTLTFDVLTPMFLGGADPVGNDCPDRFHVRPIINMMAYWFRAMMGGICGGDIETVHKLEISLFGGAGGEGSTASRFRMSLKQPCPAFYDVVKDPCADPFIRYLGFGPFSTDKKKQHRQALEPATDTPITLELIAEERDERILFATLWLATTLGGFGSRQKKGFGALEWINRGEFALPHSATGLEAGLKHAGDIYREFMESAPATGGRTGRSADLTDFDILHPDFVFFKLCDNARSDPPQPFRLASLAMCAIQNQLRLAATRVPLSSPPAEPALHLGSHGFGWRQRLADDSFLPPGSKGPWNYYSSRDHDSASAAAGRAPEIVLQNPAFGLPLPFQFGNGLSYRVSLFEEGGGKEFRRPSPVSFRILRENTASAGSAPSYRFHVLCVLFKTNFIPDDLREATKLQIRAKGDNVDKGVSVKDSWKDLQSFFGGLTGDAIELQSLTKGATQ